MFLKSCKPLSVLGLSGDPRFSSDGHHTHTDFLCWKRKRVSIGHSTSIQPFTEKRLSQADNSCTSDMQSSSFSHSASPGRRASPHHSPFTCLSSYTERGRWGSLSAHKRNHWATDAYCKRLLSVLSEAETLKPTATEHHESFYSS